MAVDFRGDLKGCTKALICRAQEQALRTNYTRFFIRNLAQDLVLKVS